MIVAKKVKAVAMPRKVNRWMLVDVETGEIVDDAQGFGYRTARGAHAAWAYHHQTSEQAHRRKINQKRNREFLRKHKHFEDAWAEVCLDCYKDGTEPGYSDFKDLVQEFASDYEGSVRSLYYYVQNH